MAKRNGCKFIVTYLCWCCGDKKRCDYYRPQNNDIITSEYDPCYYQHSDPLRGVVCFNPDAAKTSKSIVASQTIPRRFSSVYIAPWMGE